MNGLSGRLRDWVEPRWAAPEQLTTFLSKPLPRNVSWAHTLGSLLLVYLGFQVLTGVLLSFYYSPSPENAYQSVRYIRSELFLGDFVFKLQRFGAGFIMVTAFLHAARSYFLAAYKAPRELLWISGLLLGVLLTLFAFTGQLLPYDQRGYWATVVGVQIASGAPGLGETVRALLTGGYGAIGATTLSRFYALHICVLPLALAALIGLHLSILQRTGSAGPVQGPPEPIRPFYPRQAVKDVFAAAVGALLLFLVAGLVASQDSGPANPAAGDFVPRPEWFFLAHYQILKYLPGSMQVIGTFVLPNALFGLLLLLPFIDRGPKRAPLGRRIATPIGALVCLTIIVLTGIGIATAPETESNGGAPVDNPLAHGRALFKEKLCSTCHTINGQGGQTGPDLSTVARRIRADYLPDWIRNPGSFKPTTEMPAFEGTDEQLEALVEYLLTLE